MAGQHPRCSFLGASPSTTSGAAPRRQFQAAHTQSLLSSLSTVPFPAQAVASYSPSRFFLRSQKPLGPWLENALRPVLAS